MKKTQINAKLSLQKETLTKLSGTQLNSINGGDKSLWTLTATIPIITSTTTSLLSSVCK